MILLAAALCFAQEAAVASPYELLLRRYAAGDRAQAVSEILGWPESVLHDRVRQGPGGVPLRVAMLLHTDAAEQARLAGSDSGEKAAKVQDSLALRLARRALEDTAQRAFVRRWYGVVAALAHFEMRWDAALAWTEQGLAEFPEATELLMVRAAIYEAEAARLAPADPERWGHLGRARAALEKALAADPGLSEARLRLGHVSWRMGQPREARKDFEAALAADERGSVAFLADLFVGRLEEDAGQLEAATRRYKAALALGSGSQAARLALSHARHGRGDVAGAQRELDSALKQDVLPGPSDPFRTYTLGASANARARLAALRAETLQ